MHRRLWNEEIKEFIATAKCLNILLRHYVFRNPTVCNCVDPEKNRAVARPPNWNIFHVITAACFDSFLSSGNKIWYSGFYILLSIVSGNSFQLHLTLVHIFISDLCLLLSGSTARTGTSRRYYVSLA
jgi:hypothetical protein